MKKDTLKNWLIVLLVLILVSALLFEWFSRYTTIVNCSYYGPDERGISSEIPMCEEHKVLINIGPKFCSISGLTWGEVCSDNFGCAKGCLWKVAPR